MHITACLTAAGPEHSGTTVSDRWKRERASEKEKEGMKDDVSDSVIDYHNSRTENHVQFPFSVEACV